MALGCLEVIVVRDMLHDLLHRAAKNITQSVDGIGFHILVSAQAVYLRAVHIVVGI